jgi:LemA protein
MTVRRIRFGRMHALGVCLLVGVAGVAVVVTRAHRALVYSSERVEATRAQVANVMHRRAELIPNLVAVAAAAAAHERDLLAVLARAESNCSSERWHRNVIACAYDVDGALGAAAVAGERYPALGATRAYEALRFEIEGSENRIAVELRRHHAAVAEHRLLLRRFPASLVARLWGFTPP